MRFWPILLLPILGCNSRNVEKLKRQNSELQKQNQELVAKLDALAKTSNLDLQAKCAKQASLVFHKQGWDKYPSSFTSHYQQKLDKCFIKVLVTADIKASFSITVLDTSEQAKDYAEYFWTDPQRKDYVEREPSFCRVTMPNGEEKTCQSRDEFEELVKVYMEQ